MEIKIEDVQKCAEKFGIRDAVLDITLLADGPDHPVPYDVIRKIIRVDFEDGKYTVMKFVREPIFTPEIINRQCAFSDLLGENGVYVPKRYRRQGTYCIKYIKESLEMDVYMEEYFKDMIPVLTVDIFGQIGRTMGRMHAISQRLKPKIGYSMLYNEVMYKDTSYERIWRGWDHSFMEQELYSRLLEIYAHRIEIVKNVWCSLPKGAVQGDIYSRNNVALHEGNVAVFDFNLAGDEVFVGDCLLCWFRTIFDERMQDELKDISQSDLWNAFWSGYLCERPLSETEKKYFPDIYAILGCLYYTKLLVHFVMTNREELARVHWKDTFHFLEADDSVVPQKEYRNYDL